MISSTLKWIWMIVMIWPLVLPAQPSDYFVDQRHDLEEVEATHSIQALSPVVQEFTPSIGGLDVIEIWTEDGSQPLTNGGGAVLQVLVRDVTMDGTIFGESAAVLLPDGWNGASRFLFTNIIWLEGAKRYAMELKVLSGDNWLVHSHGSLFPPPYPAGRYFLKGTPSESTDMWFRTGIRIPQTRVKLEYPEGLRWLGIPSMSYRVWLSTNLSEWQQTGSLFQNTTNFFFTNIVTDGPFVFYRVSQP